MARSLLQQKALNLLSSVGNITSSIVTNLSNIVGATVTDALNTVNTTISSLASSDIANLSGVTGANVTDAFNTINTSKANLNSPTFTGIPTAPTAANGTNTTQLATTAFVQSAIVGGLSFIYLKYVESLNDLPAPVGGVITLADNTAYFFTTVIDLLGSRLLCGRNTALLGSSSEIARIKSTGLIGTPLITSQWSLSMRNITIEADHAVSLNAFGNPEQALDWLLVNFENCPVIGTIKNYNNFVYTQGAFIDSEGLTFDENFATIAFNSSIFTGRGTGPIMTIAPTAVISRRFRIIYSSFVVLAGGTGIDFSVAASVPIESYILDTVNFSDGGTYLTGVDSVSNFSLFVNCKGIVNTSVNGQMYMQNNVTATTITNTVNFFKVAGITLPSSDNQKYTVTNNRLTCDAVIKRKYLIACTVSFTSGSNNVCQFGFYNSVLGSVRVPSRTLSTANASGRAENISFFCVINHSQGDYIEVWCRNTSAVTNITVTDMNVVITEIN